jgi:hypothetical protein
VNSNEKDFKKYIESTAQVLAEIFALQIQEKIISRNQKRTYEEKQHIRKPSGQGGGGKA